MLTTSVGTPPAHSERRRRGRRSGIIAVLLAVGLAAASCTAGSDPEPSETSGSGIAWEECGAFDCADVSVPVVWSEPEGEQLTLAVMRRKGSNPDERIGSMLINPGGPGGSGVELVKTAGEGIDEWGDGRFDIIGWDPRGTHDSSPVHCFETDDELADFWAGVRIPSNDEQAQEYADLMKDLAKRCGEIMGPLLSNVSTADTVRDMDHIRELLGEDKITYTGFSYGTMIGQMYANMFPEHVRAMMLDGVVYPPPWVESAEARAARDASSTGAVFAEFLALCEQAGPDKCALAGHGQPVVDRVNGLFDLARQGPIAAPDGDPEKALWYSDLQLSTFTPLRMPELWPDYAAQLEAAVEGDVSELSEQAALWRLPSSWAEATKSSSISCLEGPAEASIDDWPSVIGELNAGSALSGAIQGWWLWAPCAADWPGVSDHRYTGPWDAETEVPILVIGTVHDPNTGYQNAVDSAELLGNAVLLTHDGYGHVSYQDPSACVDAARKRYLVDLETPEPGTVCEADQKPFS